MLPRASEDCLSSNKTNLPKREMQASTNTCYKELPSSKCMHDNEQTSRPRQPSDFPEMSLERKAKECTEAPTHASPLSSHTLSLSQFALTIPNASLRTNSLVPTHTDMTQQERGILPFSVLFGQTAPYRHELKRSLSLQNSLHQAQLLKYVQCSPHTGPTNNE